jgi:hypothetical protein
MKFDPSILLTLKNMAPPGHEGNRGALGGGYTLVRRSIWHCKVWCNTRVKGKRVKGKFERLR